MRKKWKYDKQLAIDNWQPAIIFRQVAYCLLLIAYCSCGIRDEHKHIPASIASDLDGLSQPANQTVFSDVKTIFPIQKSITPIVNATGVISYDPRLINNISARFGGRIEKLYVRFNFENVSKGQRIMDIYSPELLTEQQNLIYLLKNTPNDISLIYSSKQKLQLLGFSDEQYKQVETTKQPLNPLPIYSPYTGHIHNIGIGSGVLSSETAVNKGMSSGMNNSAIASSQVQIENLPSTQSSELSLKEGMYIQNGQPVFAVYNINQVWAVLNIFPQDAPLIKIGDKVNITAETNSTNIISSSINYIEPVSGQNASAIKARVYLQNSENLHLKIGTLLSAKVTPKEINGLWLPRNAIVNLGQKQIVFLKTENHFKTKIVQTGITTDSLVQIISGLSIHESVAANAQFMVDSESFIQTEDNEKK